MNNKYLRILILFFLFIFSGQSISYAFDPGARDFGGPAAPIGNMRVFYYRNQGCLDDLVGGCALMGTGSAVTGGLVSTAYIIGKIIGEHYRHKKEQQREQQKH